MRRQPYYSLALLVAVLCFSPQLAWAKGPTSRATAIELNKQGFALYQQGRYADALEKFRASFEADDTYVYPHYNYACTLGILLREDLPNWYHRMDEVFAHLRRTVELHPPHREKMKTDPDLESVRGEFAFWKIAGLRTDRTEDVKELLTRLTWYAPGEGIFPYLGWIEFREDGSVTFSYYHPDFFETFDSDDVVEMHGTYAVSRGYVTVRFDETPLRKRSKSDITRNESELDTTRTFTGKLHEDGTLQFNELEYPFLSSYEKFSA
jgi:tetratricopeptide (TPR) repeat protein